MPHLRIVDDDLWQRTRKRQTATTKAMTKDASGNPLNRAHRRQFLLSGLLKCGVCGGGYTIAAQDRYGCATRRSKGTCSNARTITRQEIEARIFDGLKQRLLTPELVETFTRAFHEEINRLQAEQSGKAAAEQAELAKVTRELERLIDAIAAGIDPHSVKDRIATLETRRSTLERSASHKELTPVRLHPKLPEL